jgi:hypothetical protein
MNQELCGTVRELIPDLVADRLSPANREVVNGHVIECNECQSELELVRMVLTGRPSAPPELLDRLLRSVPWSRRQEPARTWWGVSAAAVAALALGIGISSEPTQTPFDVPGFAYEAQEGDIWLSDDGLMAGAPLLDGLSDDALLQLLDELVVGSSGGSA